MANNIAFTPMGKTYLVEGTVPVVSDSPVQQYYVVNPSVTDTVFVRISGTSLNAAVPTNVGAYGVAIPPATGKVLTQYQAAPATTVYVSVANSANVYVTPGEGL